MPNIFFLLPPDLTPPSDRKRDSRRCFVFLLKRLIYLLWDARSGRSDSSAGYLKPRNRRTQTGLRPFLRTLCFYLAFAPRLRRRRVTSLREEWWVKCCCSSVTSFNAQVCPLFRCSAAAMNGVTGFYGDTATRFDEF